MLTYSDFHIAVNSDNPLWKKINNEIDNFGSDISSRDVFKIYHKDVITTSALQKELQKYGMPIGDAEQMMRAADDTDRLQGLPMRYPPGITRGEFRKALARNNLWKTLKTKFWDDHKDDASWQTILIRHQL